jgi:hypothetical protein
MYLTRLVTKLLKHMERLALLLRFQLLSLKSFPESSELLLWHLQTKLVLERKAMLAGLMLEWYML